MILTPRGAPLGRRGQSNDIISIGLRESTVSALRMRFPANREFVFDVAYTRFSASAGNEDVVEVRDRGERDALSASITRLVLLRVRGVTFRTLVLAGQRNSAD